MQSDRALESCGGCSVPGKIFKHPSFKYFKTNFARRVTREYTKGKKRKDIAERESLTRFRTTKLPLRQFKSIKTDMISVVTLLVGIFRGQIWYSQQDGAPPHLTRVVEGNLVCYDAIKLPTTGCI
jgi:hypothetical protein